jgi:DNA-directed RNA polymerase beta' subunit
MTTAEEPHESDVQVGGVTLSGLQDDFEEEEEVEILGFASFFTIGEFLEVPRTFIEDKATAVDLDELYLPRKPTPKKAYTRTCSRLFYDINNDIGGRWGAYEVTTKKVKTGMWVVQAEEWDEDAEEYTTQAIGNLSYDYDDQKLRATQRTKSPNLEPIWDEVSSMARRKFDDMLETYLGSDLRDMVRKIIDAQYSVKLRSAGAVYFVPANQAEELRKAAGIVGDCNAFKKDGRPRADVGIIEVIDKADKRKLVEGRVEAEVRTEIEKVFENAVDEWNESEETEEVIRTEIEEMFEETLEETLSVTEQYNALLRAEMKVSEIVENLKSNLSSEIQEIVEETMDDMEETEKAPA